jgi:hypothetical protein
LAVIRRKVPDGDAPSVHGSSENASVKLRPVVRTKAHWDADLDKIFDDDVHTSRCWARLFVRTILLLATWSFLSMFLRVA